MTNPETYLGFWLDYSKSLPFRPTLTLTNQQASYLIAGVSYLLASIVLPILWRASILLAYLLNFARTSNQPLEVHQRQVIVRNARLPNDAFFGLLGTFKSWRKSHATSPARRGHFALLLMPAFLAMVVTGLFGVFVPSLLASDAADSIIILSKHGVCGFLGLDDRYADLKESAASTTKELAETTNGRSYAAQTYEGLQKTTGTSIFPVLTLPFTVNKSAECPFAPDFCRLGPQGAISFDTGLLDSHGHLGINAPSKDRVHYRWRSTCTPLKLPASLVNITRSGERNYVPISKAEPLIDIYLGTQGSQPYTISWKSNLLSRLGYEVKTVSARNKFSDAKNISWNPASGLNRTDADVSLIFLAPNSVVYARAVHDPVFQANGTKQKPLVYENDRVFRADNSFIFIACADQHQFCSQAADKCSQLDGILGNWESPFVQEGLTSQFATANRLRLHAQANIMEESVKTLGSNSLIAKSLTSDDLLLSPGLPSDHWHDETQLWFETGLAKFQHRVIDFVNLSLTDQDRVVYHAVPAEKFSPFTELNRRLKAQCSHQRIQSQGQVQNFSVFALALLAGLSLVIGLGCEFILPRLAKALCHNAFERWENDETRMLWRDRVDNRGTLKWAIDYPWVAVDRH
ncbi:Fc.00g082450.m01.CDS01 [Cosmosporella sp. VM-42]